MSKDIKKKADNVLTIMAKKYDIGSETFMRTLKGTIMKADKNGKVASEEEVITFLMVANKYDLNPFTKEIFAFPDKRAGIIPIVGIDGFTTIANRNKEYNGYDLEWSDEEATMMNGNKEEAKPCPKWCEIKVYRKDRDHPIVIREYLDEVYQPPRGTFSGPWQTHTKRMLRHKTIIQGFRTAFGISGVYDQDEAERIVDAKVSEESAEEMNMKPAVISPNAEQPTDAIYEDEAVQDEQPPDEQPPEEEHDPKCISDRQVKRLIAIAKSNGYDITDINVYIAETYGLNSKNEIHWGDQYDNICEHFEIQKGA